MKLTDIEQLFCSLTIGGRIHHRTSAKSTNSWALEELRSGNCLNGDIFLCDQQTDGRGQNGRTWQSGNNDGLWMSFVVLGSQPVKPLPFLPAIAIQDYLTKDLEIDAHLKWPNDVLVGNRKIAGILVEGTNDKNGSPGWVIGMGLNLNQLKFPGPLAESATSVALETKTIPSRNDALAAILGWLNVTLTAHEDLVTAWVERSRMPGRTLTFTKAEEPQEATVIGLTDEGYLRIKHTDGRIENLISSSDLSLPQEY